jgi:nitrite reductase/ring-hydroxylating ferredoxin subunit
VALVRLVGVAEVPPGRTWFMKIGGVPVILANYQGEIHALYGLCPHRNNPLEGATVWVPLLDCPFHHFQFDVQSGENHFPKRVYPDDMPRLQSQVGPLRAYPVEIRGGEVWVDLG